MTCMQLKKVKVLFSSHSPETHVKHAQSHQRADGITGSINIFQSTVLIVYEVEHQKTVNTKLGKRSICFSEVIKEFYHYLQEKNTGRHTIVESKVATHS